MITFWLLQLMGGLLSLMVSLVPTFDMPTWFTGLGATLDEFSAHAVGMDSWVPFDSLTTVVGFVLTVVPIGFAIRLVRIILSLFSGGGGNAS